MSTDTPRFKGHRWFAAFYDSMFSPRAEKRWMKEIRPRVIGGARGDVLEIGAGTGNSLPYYSGQAFKNLVLTEPDPYMRERLVPKLASLNIRAEVVDAAAEELPFPDNSFDTVISTGVLCSVRDLTASLGEVRRVLRPGGEFRFWEHVRATNKIGAFAQDIAQPLWSQMSGGCRPNRDIAAAIEQSGLEVREMERSYPFPAVQPMVFQALSRPHILGVAVRRS